MQFSQPPLVQFLFPPSQKPRKAGTNISILHMRTLNVHEAVARPGMSQLICGIQIPCPCSLYSDMFQLTGNESLLGKGLRFWA